MDTKKQIINILKKFTAIVSTGTSKDGVVSIAATLEDNIRVYFEIEPDGEIGMAVTRDKKYALDIPVSSAEDVTEEFILLAMFKIKGVK